MCGTFFVPPRRGTIFVLRGDGHGKDHRRTTAARSPTLRLPEPRAVRVGAAAFLLLVTGKTNADEVNMPVACGVGIIALIRELRVFFHGVDVVRQHRRTIPPCTFAEIALVVLLFADAA